MVFDVTIGSTSQTRISTEELRSDQFHAWIEMGPQVQYLEIFVDRLGDTTFITGKFSAEDRYSSDLPHNGEHMDMHLRVKSWPFEDQDIRLYGVYTTGTDVGYHKYPVIHHFIARTMTRPNTLRKPPLVCEND